MSRAWMRPFGDHGELISAVTLGASPLGGALERLYGAASSRDEAVSTVRAVLDSPIRAVDTANGYSGGESERRIGAGIAASGGLPDDFLVITKVDPRGSDFSGERVRQSVVESRQRLGIAKLPLVHLHDPDIFDFSDVTGRGGALEALIELRAEGEVDRIGLAGGNVHEMARYLDLGVFDALLVHNRLTIVDRSAEALVAQASEAGVMVFNAAVYGGGILTKGSTSTRYGYRPAPDPVLDSIDRMRTLCAEWGSDLGTVALQYSIDHPSVTSTVVGMSRISRVDSTLTSANRPPLPPTFWDELENHVPDSEYWLDASSASATQGPRR